MRAKRRPDKAKDEIGLGGGLYLRISASGHKSYGCRFRFRGAQRNLSLGDAEGPKKVTLAEAKAAAAAALVRVAKGTDPTAEKRKIKEAARKQEVAKSGDTTERWVEEFLDAHVRVKTGATHQQQAAYVFRDLVLPRWKGRLVQSITRRDVRELLRHVGKTRPIMANRLQSHLSRLFRWLLNEDVITAHPGIGIERVAPEVERDRTLNDDEIRAFWAATEQLPGPFDAIYQVLLLSGCRRQEIGGMKWDEIKPDPVRGRAFTISANAPGRSKPKLPTVLPLGPRSWKVIDRQQKISDYVFGVRRSGFSHMKDKLDAHMTAELGTLTPWRTHDIRRTARTLMSRAGVTTDTAELMIGHVLPGTVRRIYDRWGYFDEKANGFVKLETLIDTILNPPPTAAESPPTATIITLRR